MILRDEKFKHQLSTLMKIKSLFGMLALAAGAVTLQAQTVDTVTTNGLFEPYGVTADLDRKSVV